MSHRWRVVAMAHSRRQFLRVSVLGLGGVTIASLLAACGGAGPSAAPSKPAETKPAETAKPAAPAAAPAATAAPAAAAKPAEAAKPADAAKPAAAAAPAFAGGGSLKLLMRSHFVPAYDVWFDKWAADWGAKNKVTIEVDHILAGELPPKWAAEVATGDGHDILGLTQSGAVNVFNKSLVEVGDFVKQIGEAHGGWVDPLAKSIGQFNGTWFGIPAYFIEFGCNYRKDLFDANNLKPFDTWDDVLKGGKILKEKGNPI